MYQTYRYKQNAVIHSSCGTFHDCHSINGSSEPFCIKRKGFFLFLFFSLNLELAGILLYIRCSPSTESHALEQRAVHCQCAGYKLLTTLTYSFLVKKSTGFAGIVLIRFSPSIFFRGGSASPLLKMESENLISFLLRSSM